MQPDKVAVAVTDTELHGDRSMLVLQYAIGGFAAIAAILLAFLH
jgi:hypothetical protein